MLTMKSDTQTHGPATWDGRHEEKKRRDETERRDLEN